MFSQELSQKFMSLGFDISLLQEFSSEGMKLIDEEPDEETILVTTIKNQSAEIKGQRNFDEDVLEFDTKDLRPGSAMKRPSSSMRRGASRDNQSEFRTTKTTRFGSRFSSNRSNAGGSVPRDNKENEPMRETKLYFREAFEYGM